LPRGGDVQAGGDGCFSYHHIRKAGDRPISYNPSYFISKVKVDAVGDRIDQARKGKPATLEPLIPQEVLDACNTTFNAANEKKWKVDPKFYDASGVFMIVCRHGQVLFLCNINTPSEQQKYVLAGLEELISLLPPVATVLETYNIGLNSCDLHFPLLTEGVSKRVAFVLNAMHSYRHEWAC
ncbi:hypothetical protein B0H14DRAFT_2276323, partial [Mycena olivaceomarginata]